MPVVASVFKGITINKKMRLDHELFSSPETDILKYHEYKSDYKIKSRLGISSRQLYARSEIDFNWSFSEFKASLIPRINYFAKLIEISQ